jgi:hypothetical protein
MIDRDDNLIVTLFDSERKRLHYAVNLSIIAVECFFDTFSDVPLAFNQQVGRSIEKEFDLNTVPG